MKIINEKLRLVSEDDKDILLEWANDSLVRHNSFNTNLITKDEHEKWFSRLLESNDESLYIYEVNGEKVGQVRITLADDTVEIHYSIGKSMRNKGFAKRMLHLLQKELQKNYPQVIYVIAKVKDDNNISKRVLSDLGYSTEYSCYSIKIK